MLKTNTFIIGMDLGYNIIGDEGATVLGQLLQVRTLLLYIQSSEMSVSTSWSLTCGICLKQDLFCQLWGQRLTTTQFFAAPRLYPSFTLGHAEASIMPEETEMFLNYWNYWLNKGMPGTKFIMQQIIRAGLELGSPDLKFGKHITWQSCLIVKNNQHVLGSIGFWSLWTCLFQSLLFLNEMIDFHFYRKQFVFAGWC